MWSRREKEGFWVGGVVGWLNFWVRKGCGWVGFLGKLGGVEGGLGFWIGWVMVVLAL